MCFLTEDLFPVMCVFVVNCMLLKSSHSLLSGNDNHHLFFLIFFFTFLLYFGLSLTDGVNSVSDSLQPTDILKF